MGGKGMKSNSYKILFGNPVGKSSLSRPRRRCENHIKTGLRDTD
jgi:hypothetical protein